MAGRWTRVSYAVMVDGPSRIATFAAYLPRAVLESLSASGGLPGEPHGKAFPAALLLVDITGFTALTDAAVHGGAAGTERLARSLNVFFGRIIEIVAEHGGDVAKIAGDALLPMWPAVNEDLTTATHRAARCGLAIAAEQGELDLEGIRLSLKVGVCAGEIGTAHIGGLEGRWLYLITGDGVRQLSEFDTYLATGEVVASPEAWAAADRRLIGHAIGGGRVRIHSAGKELAPRPLASLTLPPELESAVRSYVPEVCLARLDAGHADWLAELRRTTVVFAGVHDVATTAPDRLSQLHRVAQAAQRVMTRYNGWLKEITTDDKGTTLIGVFGVAPFSHEDDPARALQVALTLQAEIRELGLNAGVGVTTGLALCGPVGNAARRDFAVLGRHVNLAARLLQASGGEWVLCDAATRDSVPTGQSFERLPAFVLKGLASPIDVFRVSSAPQPTGRRLAIVDRTSELAAAIPAVDAAGVGSGGLIVFEGEPGIGKSRLVEELVRHAHAAGVRPLVGLAAEIEASTPYHAWRKIFEGLLGIDATLELAARRRSVLQALADDESMTRLAPVLNPILSIDFDDTEVTTQLSGAVRADNTNDLLVRLLAREASKRPTMVVLEDAHWLDSASWSLVLQSRRTISPMLVVLTMRPIVDRAADPLGSLRGEATTLHLSPLSTDDAIDLVKERTGAAHVSEPVAAVVRERAEGNPLFIEQLTYAMRDAGQIVVDSGEVRVAPGVPDLETSITPDTVQRVITSRLDQLPPGEAMTAKVASVIGQRFALRTLVEIYPLTTETATVVGHLDTLSRLELVAPVPSSTEPAYEFRHVITQEVAYNLMPSTQSRELHRSLAEWYERTYVSDLSPYHTFLAFHWSKAGVPARAIDHLELAGARALQTFANDETIAVLEEALSLEAGAGLELDPSRLARWRLQLGDAYVNVSRYRKGREHLEAGLRLMKRAAPSTRPAQAVAVLWAVLRQLVRRTRLIQRDRSLSPAEQDEFLVVGRAYERLAEASYYGRETLLPLYCVIRVLNEAETSGLPAAVARGFAGTGALLGVVPMPRVAEWYLQRALELLGEVDDLATHEIVQIVVGFYHVGVGNWELARGQFESVRQIAQRLGDRRRLDDAIGNLAELESLRGSFDTAVALASELVSSAAARSDDRYRAEGLTDLALSSWRLGQADVALRSLRALDPLMANDLELTDELKLRIRGIAALVHTDRADWVAARTAADMAMGLTAHQRPASFGTFVGYAGPAEAYLALWETGQGAAEGQGLAADALSRLRSFAKVFPVGRPRSALLEGRHDWLRGRREDAMRSWDRAIQLAESLSMPYEQGLAHYEIARHLEPTDAAQANHLAASRNLFSELHASRDLARVDLVEAGSGYVG
jgi:class 3 adenylate cyclase/tetratricopeptide (TPR) repeat protein